MSKVLNIRIKVQERIINIGLKLFIFLFNFVILFLYNYYFITLAYEYSEIVRKKIIFLIYEYTFIKT